MGYKVYKKHQSKSDTQINPNSYFTLCSKIVIKTSFTFTRPSSAEESVKCYSDKNKLCFCWGLFSVADLLTFVHCCFFFFLLQQDSLCGNGSNCNAHVHHNEGTYQFIVLLFRPFIVGFGLYMEFVDNNYCQLYSEIYCLCRFEIMHHLRFVCNMMFYLQLSFREE